MHEASFSKSGIGINKTIIASLAFPKTIKLALFDLQSEQDNYNLQETRNKLRFDYFILIS